MINLRAQIDSLATHDVGVYRIAQHAVSDGVVTEQETVLDSTVKACVQPMGGKDLLSAPEGFHAKELWTVFCYGANLNVRDQLDIPGIGRVEIYSIADRDRGQGQYQRVLCKLIMDARNAVFAGSAP